MLDGLTGWLVDIGASVCSQIYNAVFINILFDFFQQWILTGAVVSIAAKYTSFEYLTQSEMFQIVF